MLKRCSKCRAEKPLESFATSRGKSDGRQSYCRACAGVYGKVRMSTRRRVHESEVSQ